MLKTRKVDDLNISTPTKWQTVILRNYGLIKTENIAKVLNARLKG